MAESYAEISDIRLKPAENGYILCYTEVSESPAVKGQTYANKNYDYKEEVYQDSQLNKAVKRMTELAKKMREDEGGEETDGDE